MTRKRANSGFTLVELIVVIGILVILIGLLIPVVSRVRRAGYQADTNAFIMSLVAACQRYHDDHKAYPGPLHNNEIRNNPYSSGWGIFSNVLNGAPAPAVSGFDNSAPTVAKFTGCENLVLGLCGGLRLPESGETPTALYYDPRIVGTGPRNLNAAQKRYNPYAEAANLTPSFVDGSGNKTGHFSDGSGHADDTIVPEFCDRYPESMPLLYLRAKLGVAPVQTSAAGYDGGYNSVVTDNQPWPAGDPTGGFRYGPYDIGHVLGYTGAFTGTYPALTLPAGTYPPAAGAKSIGGSKSLKQYGDGTGNIIDATTGFHGLRTANTASVLTPGTVGYFYPYDAFAFLKDPSTTNNPRAKDMFIIISAGSDRVYGTSDDITSFGPVQ